MSDRAAWSLLLLMLGPAAQARPSDSFPMRDVPASCGTREGWTDPAPPARIFANTWYVGTCGISAVLVTSPQGHVLVDTGMAESADALATNIERLGFRLADVRWIVTSHDHFDHTGALARLKRRTGARIAALPATAAVLESGQPDPADPQFGLLKAMEPVKVDRVLRDGETIALGSLRLTAHATPAHSPGSTSWTWTSCEQRVCHRIAYADSATTPAADAYRFTRHPDRIAAVDRGLAAIGALPCDILITPHPSASDLFTRFAGTRPLAARGACLAYARAAQAAFSKRIAAEREARP